jgi:hypothetical protein
MYYLVHHGAYLGFFFIQALYFSHSKFMSGLNARHEVALDVEAKTGRAD